MVWLVIKGATELVMFLLFLKVLIMQGNCNFVS